MKFASQIDQIVNQFVYKPKTWLDKLDASARKEIEAIKAGFKSGKYGTTSKRSLARAIVAAARERGWPVCGECGVREWLAKD